MPFSTGWSLGQEEIVRRHWGGDDPRTAAEIGLLTNHSRNAVIGKAQRLGLGKSRSLTGRAERKAGAPARRRREAVAAARSRLLAEAAAPDAARAIGRDPVPALVAPPKPVPKRPALSVVSTTGGLTMAELTEATCRYPYGERPAEMTFCGVPAAEGLPYCDEHYARCYVDPATRVSRRPAIQRKRGRFSLAVPS